MDNNFSLENMSIEELDLLKFICEQHEEEQDAILYEMRVYVETCDRLSAAMKEKASANLKRVIQESIENNRFDKMSQVFHEANKFFLEVTSQSKS